MRIQVLSDLHLEFWRDAPDAAKARAVPRVVGDVLVLAGDIDVGTRGMDAFAGVGVPVIYVAGNHEFYDGHLNLVNRELAARASELGVHYLDNTAVVVDGVRFLGCTLWTDFRLYPGLERLGFGMHVAKERIRDFSVIRTANGWFTPQMSVLMHQVSVAWLGRELAQPFDGPTVVVTHHAPSQGSVAARFAGNELNPAFASELGLLAGRAPLWIHGHTHDSFDYDWQGTRVVCNPRGYPLRRTTDADGAVPVENARFDANFVVEV